jgi:hypothetical protein
LRATSRDPVLGARPIRTAMARQDSPAATPRETSSRSAAPSWPAARRRGGSRRPPVRIRNRRTFAMWVPKWRAITRSASPRRYRAQISSCAAGDHRPATVASMPHLR